MAFGVDWKDGTIVLAFEIDTVMVIFHDDEKYGIRTALCPSPCAARYIMRGTAPAAQRALVKRRTAHGMAEAEMDGSVGDRLGSRSCD